jgi:hypothetical protein
MDSTNAAELSQDIKNSLFVREDLKNLVDFDLTSDSERSSVEKALFHGSKIRYVLGNERSDKISRHLDGSIKEPAGKELEAGHYKLKLVANQSGGLELNKNKFSSSARGPVVLTVPINYDGDYRFFTIKVVPTSGELYEVVAPSDVAKLNEIGYEVNMGAPRQKDTNVSNISLKRTNNGLNVKIQYEVKDVIMVHGGEVGREDEYTDYQLRVKGDDKFVRKFSAESKGQWVNILDLEGSHFFQDSAENGLMVDSGNILFDNIPHSGGRVEVEENLANSVTLKPPIEGYTIRMFLFNGQVHVVTYTRLDNASKYAKINPVDTFHSIMNKNGIDVRSFFPKGCKTSPITYFFHVGTNALIMNSRLNYVDLNSYVMFAFAISAWSYGSIEHQVLERIYGDLGTEHHMLQDRLQMIPPQFKECTYGYNVKWPELCYQGPELRVNVIHALTDGVIGEDVSVRTGNGTREDTDPRLFPGEAVVAVLDNNSSSNQRIHPIKFMSQSYNWRSLVRGGEDWPFQSWFRLATIKELQVKISFKLFNSLKNEYLNNKPVPILPHYDTEEKMSSEEVKSNFVEYITVLWLYSLPIHAQANELEARNGFMGIVNEINSKLNQLAEHIGSMPNIPTLKDDINNRKFTEFINNVSRAVHSIRLSQMNEGKSNRRSIMSTKPSLSLLIRALIGKNERESQHFYKFRKFYFSTTSHQLSDGNTIHIDEVDLPPTPLKTVPFVKKVKQSERKKNDRNQRGTSIRIKPKKSSSKKRVEAPLEIVFDD